VKACSKQWVLGRRWKICDDDQVQMLEGSEFHRENGDTEAMGGKGLAVSRNPQ